MPLELAQLIDESGQLTTSDIPGTEHLRYKHYKGFTDANDACLSEPVPESFISRWLYSGDSGEINFLRIEIRPGFEIWVAQGLFKEEVICSMLGHPSSLAFGFCLAGHSTSRFCTLEEDLVIQEGSHGIYYGPCSWGISKIAAGLPFLHIGVCLDADQMRYFFKNDRQLLPSRIQQILDHNPDENFCKIGSFTPAMLKAAQDIIACRQRGFARKLFLESKGLELIAYQMENIAMAKSGRERIPAIHPEDRRQTEYAHSLLVSNIDQPPQLKDLAQAVGMSHPKLNRCFKQVFGSTVFEYLRNERLLRARDMLEQPGVTVTEVAYSVGYNSPSHFSQAYKKFFGRLPRINPE